MHKGLLEAQPWLYIFRKAFAGCNTISLYFLSDLHKESSETLANQEVTDVEAHIPQQQLSEYWLKQLDLRLDDRDELLKQKWLTDKHIRAVNKLLRRQHPKQNGLQDTLLLTEQSVWESESNRFIQIINVNRQHWVCASNVGCPKDVVDIYDSIPEYSIGSFTLRRQIATIIHTTNPTFELRFIDVQRQSGAVIVHFCYCKWSCTLPWQGSSLN